MITESYISNKLSIKLRYFYPLFRLCFCDFILLLSHSFVITLVFSFLSCFHVVDLSHVSFGNSVDLISVGGTTRNKSDWLCCN